jgi:predicted anti-sigma-YlaC factor YlaD
MMSGKYCEKVQMSAMAIRDGEAPLLSKEDISEHLKSCADCRNELKRQETVSRLFSELMRRSYTEDIWPTVAAAIKESAASRNTNAELFVFGLFGFVLLVCKIAEVLPGITPVLAIKLLSLVAVFVFFAIIKQNPFSLSLHLIQGDKKC